MNSRATILHIAMDIEEQFLDELPPQERDRLCASINAYTDAVRPYMPTLYSVCGRRFRIHDNRLTPRSAADNQALIRNYGLQRSNLQPGEDVIVKNYDDLFSNYLVGDHLRNNYPKVETLVFSGMNTGVCVAKSVLTALTCHFQCIAITDLLADIHCGPKTPEENQTRLTERVIDFYKLNSNRRGLDPLPSEIEELLSGLSFSTAADFITAHKEKPAPPARATPVIEVYRASA